MKFCSLSIIASLIFGPSFCLSNAAAKDFYIAKNNAVYVTSARELTLPVDHSLVPLALQSPWGWRVASIVFYSPSKKDIETIPLSDLSRTQGSDKLELASLLIDDSKIYLKTGTPRLFKKYPTDSYPNSVDVTSTSCHGILCVFVAPTQKAEFAGSTCFLTDIKTGRDIRISPIDEVYTFQQPEMRWIDPSDVLCFEYCLRGNGGYIIDTQRMTRTSAWDAVIGAQYFSTSGSKLTFCSKNKKGELISRQVKN